MNYADNNLIKCNTDLRGIVLKLTQKYQESMKLTESDKELLVFFYLTKAAKTHAAIIFLCSNGYGGDAAMLSRSLFELLVTMKYILADSTDVRINRFISHSWIFKNETHDNLLKYNPDMKDFAEAAEKIKEIKENARLAQEKYNYKPYGGWSDKNMNEMAKEVGEADDFLTCYGITSSFIHPSSSNINEYVKQENGHRIFDAGASEKTVNFALATAFNFYIKLCVEVNKFLCLGFEDEFIKLTSTPLPSI